MFFKRLTSKGLAHFSYMIGDQDQLMVIDPRRDVQEYIDTANAEGMRISHILETHRHEDFTLGSVELSKKTGATICISSHEDLGYAYGEAIEDGHEIKLGSLRIRAIHTPGHTLGHLSYLVTEEGRDKAYMVFTGDALFMGDAGRTDFYGEENLEKMTGLLYESITEKLFSLGDHVLAFPAHGHGSACGSSMEQRPYTTLGYERLFNPVLQVDSKEEFIERFARMRIKPRYFNQMEINNVKGAPFIGHQTSLPPITLQEIREQKAVLFDLRPKEAFMGAHIPGSIYLSKGNFSSFAGNLVDLKTPMALIHGENAQDALLEVYTMARRIGFEEVIGYLPDALTLWSTEGNAVGVISSISAEDYRRHGEDYLVLDVRKKEEISDDDPLFERVHMELVELDKRAQELPRDRVIYTLCASGDRATTAASYLKSIGIDAQVIIGGMKALKSLEA